MKKLFMRLQKKLVADGKKVRVGKVYINYETGEIVMLKNKFALRLYAMADGLIYKYWGFKDWKFEHLQLNAE